MGFPAEIWKGFCRRHGWSRDRFPCLPRIFRTKMEMDYTVHFWTMCEDHYFLDSTNTTLPTIQQPFTNHSPLMSPKHPVTPNATATATNRNAGRRSDIRRSGVLHAELVHCQHQVLVVFASPESHDRVLPSGHDCYIAWLAVSTILKNMKINGKDYPM